MTGTVKFFNDTKGFGFITNNEDQSEVFVHCSAIVNSDVLSKGEQVNFEIQEGRKGIEAINVERL